MDVVVVVVNAFAVVVVFVVLDIIVVVVIFVLKRFIVHAIGAKAPLKKT